MGPAAAPVNKLLLQSSFYSATIIGMNDAQVIEALGGHAAVAEKLGVSRDTARHFAKRVIPWRYRDKIKKLARGKKIALPADFLEVQRGVS